MTPILCDAAIEGDIRRLLAEQAIPSEVALEDGDILVRFPEDLVRAHQVGEDSVLVTVEGPISYVVWREMTASGQRFPSQVVRAAASCWRRLQAEQLRAQSLTTLQASATPSSYWRLEDLRAIHPAQPCVIPPLPRWMATEWVVHVWLRFPTGWSDCPVPSLDELRRILEVHGQMWELVRAQLAEWDAAVADHAREVT